MIYQLSNALENSIRPCFYRDNTTMEHVRTTITIFRDRLDNNRVNYDYCRVIDESI